MQTQLPAESGQKGSKAARWQPGTGAGESKGGADSEKKPSLTSLVTLGKLFS